MADLVAAAVVPGVPSVEPPLPAEISKARDEQIAERQRLLGQQDELTFREQQIFGDINQLSKDYDAAMARKEAALRDPTRDVVAASRRLSQTAEQPLPPSEAANLQYQPHQPDVERIQGLSTAVLALAMIGGVASRGNWLGAASFLNGSLKGIVEGDAAKAEKEWNDFQRSFEVAQKHDKAALDRMAEVRDNAQLSLNAKMSEWNIIAAEYNLEPERIALRQKSIDQVLRLIEGRRSSNDNALVRLDNSAAQIEGAIARAKAVSGPDLTPFALATVNRLREITGGDSPIVKGLASRWSSGKMTPQFNAQVAAEVAKDPTLTPDKLAASMAYDSVKWKSTIAASRQTYIRETGVARLTLAVQGMEEKIDAVAKKYGLNSQRWMNAPMNAIRNQLGDREWVKFHDEVTAVARQYIEAITMPGSNAQLHAGSQQTADTLISDTMTLAQIHGAFEAFNEEIQVTGAALQSINERLLDSLGQPGIKSLFEYKGPMFEDLSRPSAGWGEITAEPR